MEKRAEQRRSKSEKQTSLKTLSKPMSSHGGLDRWRNIGLLSAEVSCHGALPQVVGSSHTLKDSKVQIEPQNSSVQIDFGLKEPSTAKISSGKITLLERNIRTEIATENLQFGLSQKWEEPETIIFASEFFRHILLTPYILSLDNVKIMEISAPHGLKNLGSCLEARFLAPLASLSNQQQFYFAKNGLLKRHDFSIKYSNATKVSRYPSAYKDINGFMIPTVHEVFMRLPDGTVLPEPLVLSVTIKNIKIQQTKEIYK